MKKLLICLMALTMTVCTGCAEKSSEGSDGSAVSSAAEEGVFDFNSTVSDIKICGQDVSLPCTFKELGAGFKYDAPIEDNSNYMFSTLRYGDTDIGVIYLELSKDGNYDDSQIVSLILNSRSGFSVKGITSDTTEEDIKKALGEDFTKTDLNIDYGNEEDGQIRILLNSVTNTPSSVTIMMPKK